jgi:hypothetical protein
MTVSASGVLVERQLAFGRQIDGGHAATSELALDAIAIGQGGRKELGCVGQRTSAPERQTSHLALMHPDRGELVGATEGRALVPRGKGAGSHQSERAGQHAIARQYPSLEIQGGLGLLVRSPRQVSTGVAAHRHRGCR